MNVTRNGKIARLPKAVRDELNRRLADGEPGKRLVGWLNAQPEVQAAVIAEFGGRAMREQNLSEWRQGGYRDWQAQQAVLEQGRQLAADVAELQQEGGKPLSETLAQFLAAQYVLTVQGAVREANGRPVELATLRVLCGDVTALRRGDQNAERLRMERERLEFEQTQKREKTEAEFMEWAMRPENRHRIHESHLSDEERQQERARRMREIFCLAPEQPKAVAATADGSINADQGKSSHDRKADPTESDSIRPDQTQCANAPLGKKPGAM